MGLDAVKSGLDTLSSRFLVVNFLPTAITVLFPLALILAGAPGHEPDWSHAWHRLTAVGVAVVLWTVFGLLVLALLLRPLQTAVLRWFEGYWPTWLARGAAVLCARKARRRDRLAADATSLPADPLAPDAGPAVQKAGRAGAALRRDYPPGALLPTDLGNVLAAAENRAGAPYGFSAVVAWPRLYPVLPDRIRAMVDDQRNSLDAAVMMTAALAVVALAAVGLLADGGWWVLLALVPAAGAVAAHRGALHAAVGYGEVVDVAFELHRFDLYQALHLPLPADLDAERRLARGLCLLWRQGVVPASPLGYVHAAAVPGATTGRQGVV